MEIKFQFSLHSCQKFSLSIMATLRNKRTLAAVSRETPENARNSQSQNTFDPEIAQEYISQVSEEIKWRVTKKLSKEFSRTESYIFGDLSKLDEFLLNPQVRTCSLAVPETSGNSNSENREPTGDRPLNNPCPEVVCSSHHSGHLYDSELDETHYNIRSPHKTDSCRIFAFQNLILNKLLEQLKNLIVYSFNFFQLTQI